MNGKTDTEIDKIGNYYFEKKSPQSYKKKMIQLKNNYEKKRLKLPVIK